MAKQTLWLVLLIEVVWFSVGFAVPAETVRRQRAYENALIEDVPHILQKRDFCGEACAEMYLHKLGRDIDQDYVFNQAGVDPLKARGCRTAELVKALKKIGFEVGDVWYKVAADNAEQHIEGQFKALHADLIRGIPSIICMHYDDTPQASEHFRLVLGYDSEKDQVLFHEPAEPQGAYLRMDRTMFLKLWPLKYEKRQWTLIRIKLKPVQIEDPEQIAGFTNADYAQHMMELKKNIPNETFTVIIQKPFVVLGDGQPDKVRRYANRTVAWAVEKLKQDYFEKDPNEIIDIWLFKDKTSYGKYTAEIFHDNPVTPYGYFSLDHNSIIVNISSGSGTLVHEIAHPFIRTNFPECPAWFNEGLASLYEQSRERKGRIWGLTNWRLAGLKKSVRAGSLLSFQSLLQTTESQFHQNTGGGNYAQARYLCYYLQERQLLTDFYKEFYANRFTDPAGLETLKKVLNEKDMDAFQKRWEKFVLTLKYP